MKIYVAARFTDKEMVQDVYRKLTQAGHNITADWTKHKNVKPYDEHPVQAGEYATEDMSGVMASDVFILFTSAEPGSGVSAELGGAIACNTLTGKPRIYVVGPYAHTNAFFFHPAVYARVDRFDEIIAELK